MFCPKCGNQLPDGASFCGSCGTQLAAAVPPQAAPQAAYQQPAQTQGAGAYGTASAPQPAAVGAGIDPKLLTYARMGFAALIAILLVVPWLSITGLNSLVDYVNESALQYASDSPSSATSLVPKPGAINLSVPGAGDVLGAVSQGISWTKNLAEAGGGVLGEYTAREFQQMTAMVPSLPTGLYGFWVVVWFITLVLAVANGVQLATGAGSSMMQYVGFGLAALISLVFIIAAATINGSIADAVRSTMGLAAMAGSSVSDAAALQMNSLISKGFVGTTPAPIIVLVLSVLGMVATFLGSRARR